MPFLLSDNVVLCLAAWIGGVISIVSLLS